MAKNLKKIFSSECVSLEIFTVNESVLWTKGYETKQFFVRSFECGRLNIHDEEETSVSGQPWTWTVVNLGVICSCYEKWPEPFLFSK